MGDGKGGLLVVSFGTSYPEMRRKTFGAIEGCLGEEFPGWELRRAYTSPTILKRLNGEGTKTDSLPEALERLALEGIRRVLAQPTYVMEGYEHDGMVETLKRYVSRFERVAWGKPLLGGPEDERRLADILWGLAGPYAGAGTELVFVGHGTGHPANAAYAGLDRRFAQAGMSCCHVGTVEAGPGPEDVMGRIRASGARKVVLFPLLIAAGDHAVRDIAGDGPDSWKSRFQSAGYEVECVMKGLGEYREVRRMFADHARTAMGRLTGSDEEGREGERRDGR